MAQEVVIQILDVLFMAPGYDEDMAGIDRIPVHEGDEIVIVIEGV